jgi:hypothetical protein
MDLPLQKQAVSIAKVLDISICLRHRSVASLLLLFVAGPSLLTQNLASAACQSASEGVENPRLKANAPVQSVLERTRLLLEQVRSTSYPELSSTQIQIRNMNNEADFFRARLRFPDFFFRSTIRYVIRVDPRVFELQAPEAGVRAIMAHELGHVAYLKKRNRLQLLGMVALISNRFATRFERRTDLEAISRGYAEGLKAYRQWLYQNVPATKLKEKQQRYFSPTEIEMLVSEMGKCPGLLQFWTKNPRLNLKEIEEEPTKNPALCGSR